MLCTICWLLLLWIRWKFAYSCVLGETVRRRHRMWSWQHMKAHRQLCAEYKDLYKTKLLSTKHTAKLLADVEVFAEGLTKFWFLFFHWRCSKDIMVLCCSLAPSPPELRSPSQSCTAHEGKMADKFYFLGPCLHYVGGSCDLKEPSMSVTVKVANFGCSLSNSVSNGIDRKFTRSPLVVGKFLSPLVQ